jgi:hypothetical protein
MGSIPLLILFVLFIIENKITFVNHFAEFFGNIFFYCLFFTVYCAVPVQEEGKTIFYAN